MYNIYDTYTTTNGHPRTTAKSRHRSSVCIGGILPLPSSTKNHFALFVTQVLPTTLGFTGVKPFRTINYNILIIDNMGVQQRQEMSAVELTALSDTKLDPFSNDEHEHDLDDDGSSASTTSSLSLDISCHASNDAETDQLPPTNKVLEIPPYWIYGALPTDKEYGRWIRSQMAEKHSPTQKQLGPKHPSRRKHDESRGRQDRATTSIDNPWKWLHRDLQGAIAEGIAMATKIQHNNRVCGMQNGRGKSLELSCLST
jgi:hypothetical protein